MRRRAFLVGLGAALVEPVVEAPIRRVYSFLWTPPEPKIIVPEPEIVTSTGLGPLIANEGKNWWMSPHVLLGAIPYMMWKGGW